MKYPEGTEIRVGQVIWVNEGESKGVVTEIVEDVETLNRHGLSDMGIFIDLSDTPTPPYKRHLFIAENFFVAEGIGVVDEFEEGLGQGEQG
jgi:hypothetical protein